MPPQLPSGNLHVKKAHSGFCYSLKTVGYVFSVCRLGTSISAKVPLD